MSLGLRTRIVVIASGAMLVALSSIILVSSWAFHREYTKALESRSVAIATSLEVELERVLQLGLPLENLVGFEEQCQEVARVYPGVGYAMVVARDGTILFHSDPADRGQKLADAALLAALRSETPTIVAFSAGGHRLHGAVVPVLAGQGEREASVVVDFPAELTTRKAVAMAVSNVELGMLFLGLGTLALVAALSALVTNPLSKLIRAIDAIRAGPTDLSRRVAASTYGDLGRLARAFNGLMGELEATTVSKSELEDALRVLREAEERYRRVVETSPSAIFVDCGSRLVFVNPSGVGLLGAAAPGELLGRAVLDFVHSESREQVKDLLRSLGEGAQTLRARDVKMVRLDGGSLEVELTGIAFRYDGAPAAQIVVHDVTEHKAMQTQLVAAGRLASLGTLARGVAHEINNPLAYVISGLDFVADDLSALAGALPKDRLAETIAAVGDARRGANQVRCIVNDLQAFARDKDRVEPVDLERVLDLATNIASSQIRYRARLVKSYGEVPPVAANEARLGQVFLNLLLNAAHAIPEGRPEANEIRVVTRMDGPDRVVVEVHDTGTGIPRDVRDRVFDPFFTTKGVGAGTGLGLFISQGIVRAMGGEIRLETETGRGTTFFTTLPAARGLPEARRKGPPSAAAPAP